MYQCGHCKKGFTELDELKCHLRTYKAYQCGLCKKAFKKSDDLKRHIRTHTGEKPYMCHFPGCISCFKESYDLTIHVRNRHHPDAKPHKCDTCGAKFNRPYELRKHKCKSEDTATMKVDLSKSAIVATSNKSNSLPGKVFPPTQKQVEEESMPIIEGHRGDVLLPGELQLTVNNQDKSEHIATMDADLLRSATAAMSSKSNSLPGKLFPSSSTSQTSPTQDKVLGLSTSVLSDEEDTRDLWNFPWGTTQKQTELESMPIATDHRNDVMFSGSKVDEFHAFKFEKELEVIHDSGFDEDSFLPQTPEENRVGWDTMEPPLPPTE